MNSAYSFNSSASSSHYCLDLNEDHIPGYEQNGSTLQKAAASSSTCPAFCNLARDYQSESQLQHSTQTLQKTDEDSSKDRMKMADHENRSSSTKDNGSTKRTSSKMRIMRRMLHSNDSSGTDRRHMLAKSNNSGILTNQINSADYCNNSAAEVVPVCSDCRTTKTPLWRGGPQGPKSLCNACGIRRRKAREAIALAAEAAQNDTDSVDKMEYNSFRDPSKVHKEKKLRTSYHDVKKSSQTTVKSTLSFEDFAMSLINKKSTESFPRDEEEAAILLMALSCGLIHS